MTALTTALNEPVRSGRGVRLAPGRCLFPDGVTTAPAGPYLPADLQQRFYSTWRLFWTANIAYLLQRSPIRCALSCLYQRHLHLEDVDAELTRHST